MLISLADFRKPFLIWKFILTNRKDKNNHYTKNHIQALHDKMV